MVPPPHDRRQSVDSNNPHATAVDVQKSVVASLRDEFPNATPMTEDEWTAGADVKYARRLVKDKNELLGVPLKITGVAFRDGIVKNEGGKQRIYNYVSIEAEIGPAVVLAEAARRGANPTPFRAGELVVFNDGSTGLCRELVSYLHAKGYIIVPEGAENGGAGESRYDAYRADWTIDGAPTAPGEDVAIEIPKGLVLMGGLRVSTYKVDGINNESATYYIS